MSNLRRLENGQGLVEYALILVLIAVVVIAVLALTGTNLNMVFARILLQIDHPGDYSGDPVNVTSMDFSADPGWTGEIIASATVFLDVGGTPNVCVQFSDSNHGSKIDCGSNPEVDFPGGSAGNVKACVIGVQGYSLMNGPYCKSDSY